jgi:hypothetical protein
MKQLTITITNEDGTTHTTENLVSCEGFKCVIEIDTGLEKVSLTKHPDFKKPQVSLNGQSLADLWDHALQCIPNKLEYGSFAGLSTFMRPAQVITIR